MLVLQRKAGESICIGDNIKVVVVEVRGHRVRLGFDCPDDVGILRSELCRLTKRTNTWPTPWPGNDARTKREQRTGRRAVRSGSGA